MARPRKNAAAVTAPGNHDRSTAGANEPKPKRARKSKRPSQPQRSSAYRGVTRHRWTGRFEAHLWDKDTTTPRTRNHDPQPQAVAKKTKKGRQVYLGAYDDEEAAARAHDLAALKYWGPGTVLNFPLCSYEEELREMEAQSREEYVGSVRRKSSGFSRGVSKYRGVARHHHNGRWEARIGRVVGNKYLYLGTYATQEEAAVAYDIAAIEHRGINAVTNFDIGHYVNWHRRRRSLLGKEGLDATGMSPIPPLPADDDKRDTVAAAACLDDAPPPSALVLLLQASPKFTEIMEQAVSAAALTTTECNDNSSPSSPCSTSSSSTSVPSRPSPERQQPDERISGGASSSSSSARCGFPDDVQTYFECDEDDGISLFALAEVDTFLFGDLGSYAAPMFQCDDLDVFVRP